MSILIEIVRYALVSGTGLVIILMMCLLVLGWGVVHRSKDTLWLGGAFLLPAAYLSGFQPFFPFDLHTGVNFVSIWCSMLLSPLAATVGVWQRSRTILLISATLALPMGILFIISPANRLFSILPLLHLFASMGVRFRERWPARAMLGVIWGLQGIVLLSATGLIARGR